MCGKFGRCRLGYMWNIYYLREIQVRLWVHFQEASVLKQGLVGTIKELKNRENKAVSPPVEWSAPVQHLTLNVLM